jgi:hypothetical protein
MTAKTIKVPAWLIAGKTQDGRTVYHCLRWCNRITREFCFTLDPKGITEESRGTFDLTFDARDLPDRFLPDVGAKALAVGKYPADHPPIKWVLAALNDGHNPFVQGGAA